MPTERGKKSCFNNIIFNNIRSVDILSYADRSTFSVKIRLTQFELNYKNHFIKYMRSQTHLIDSLTRTINQYTPNSYDEQTIFNSLFINPCEIIMHYSVSFSSPMTTKIIFSLIQLVNMLLVAVYFF